jgi:broad specificity phosphatase PhoE
MKWYILRHADKELGGHYNPVLRHQDEPISARGRAQAQALVDYFAGLPIATIYVSQYLRTLQTIEFVAQEKGLTPVVDGRLNEIDNGLIEGLTDGEIQQKFPAVWRAFNERKHDFRFPQGESGKDVQQRLRSFIQEKQQDNQDILLVSHDGLIRLAMCEILGLPVFRRWDFRVDFCGITEIEYQPAFGRWRLARFNHIF